ncbi:conserved hypothetical protein [Talaromyces stipitatus ATCC 10500]|uniref:Uncharacterized protein n=1 Tax=Talaromyces stipitatus (strain ATCC 10500 / CBS 375.48 / QM 6759 / NRRL 1006) TaxID=441959 RepID=B8MIL8_TALSN|nr:uncharacterized protein TSTA_045680 [Talaromyces stipitatus ATCC 10500]EED15110.1 conserved hypothetical protein [Talaromyces stipitatus ATCC 10500]
MTTPQSTETNTDSTHTTSTTTTTDIYNLISTYDFSSDLEFRKGLGTILGHPAQPASDAEVVSGDDVVFQAKCYYISRKRNINPSIDFKSYKNWLVEHGVNLEAATTNPPVQNNEKCDAEDSNAAIATTSTQSILAPSSQEEKKKSKNGEPAYPSSFAHIVELITNNQPIPGIEDIPDTVLSGHDEPSKAAKRRKPWEKNVDVETVGGENQV